MATKTEQLHKALVNSGWKRVDSRSSRDCYSKALPLKEGKQTTVYAWPGERGNLRINGVNRYTDSIAASEKFLKKWVFED